ncbi:MAG: carboxypeptidase regulatory-like domain-containing protein, partial [Myxococcota bacterium]
PAELRPPRAEGSAAPDAPHGRLEGEVRVRGTAAPVPGAELTFLRDGASQSVRSDAAGRFVLNAQAPGAHELAAVDAPGFAPWAPSWGHSPVRFVARAGRVVRGLRVSLEPSQRLTVEVVDGEGAAVPDAELRVLGPAGRPFPVETPAPTDAAGESRVNAPEGALVEARAQGGLHRGRARVDLRATLAGRLRVVLAGHGDEVAILGQVRGLDGAPVSGALVRATPAADDGSLQLEARALTGPEGRFRLAPLDAALYEVEARAAGHAREGRLAEAPSELQLVLGEESGLRGRVLGPEGTPAAAVARGGSAVLGPVERSLRDVREVYADDGGFEVGGLASGVYELRAVVEGAAPSAPLRVDLPAGRWTDVGALRVTPGGRLQGVIRGGATGRDRLEGAWVTLEGVAAEAPLALRREAQSDAGGNFRFEGLGLGRRSLTVTAEGHHARIVSGLEIVADEPARIEIRLEALGEGEGEARLQLVGIGAVLAASGEGLDVGRVIEGGGAANAGLAPGDTILAVDGRPVPALGFEGAIERIRGAEGSRVTLRVRRGELERDVTVTRVPVET